MVNFNLTNIGIKDMYYLKDLIKELKLIKIHGQSILQNKYHNTLLTSATVQRLS